MNLVSGFPHCNWFAFLEHGEPVFRVAELQRTVDYLLIFNCGGGGMTIAQRQGASKHNDWPSWSM